MHQQQEADINIFSAIKVHSAGNGVASASGFVQTMQVAATLELIMSQLLSKL